MQVAIIDYNAGNIRSIVNMLRVLGVKSRIAGEPDAVASADKLLLPGVGHFDHGMGELRKRGLVGALPPCYRLRNVEQHVIWQL